MSSTGERRFRYLAIVLYALVVTLVASRHEPWQDELQAWRIAIDSTSLADLVRNLRYEGHPLLWYLVLRCVGWLARDWAAAVAANVLIAIAAAWLIIRYSPFSRWQRVLVICSYFFVYEYAVITRSYGLGVLLAMAACAAWCASRPRRWLAAVLLALLANTSAVGLVLSLAMSIGFGFDYWRETATIFTGLSRVFSTRLATVSGLAAIITISLVVVQILPPRNGSFHGTSVQTTESPLYFIGRAVTTPARVFFPIAKTTPAGRPTWGTWRFEPVTRVGLALADVVTVLIFVVGAVAVSRRSSALLLWGAGFGGLILFFTFFFSGSLRHHGYIAVALIAAAWLAFAKPPDQWPRAHSSPERDSNTARARRNRAFAMLLLPMAVLSPQMVLTDFSEQFSEGESVVTLLRNESLDTLPIVGLSRLKSQAVAALLDRAVFLVHEGKNATFVDHGSQSARRPPAAVREEAERVVRRALEDNCRLVLLSDKQLAPSDWIVRRSRHLMSSSEPPFRNGEGLDVWLVTSPRVFCLSRPAH